MKTNILNLIDNNSKTYNFLSNVAITQIKNSRTTKHITYKNLFKDVNNASNHLIKLNLNQQDKIYINTRDSLNFIITFLAAIKIGIVPIPGNPELSSKQKKFIVKDSKPVLIISDDNKIFNNIKNIKLIKSSAWIKKLHIKINKDLKYYIPNNNQPAFIIYSSGTTGNPKGIIHTHDSIKSTINLHHKILKLNVGEKIYTTSKLFFAYAIGNNFFAPLILGLNSIFNDNSKPPTISKIIKSHKPMAIFSVPTMYRRILNNKLEKINNFKKVKYFISAGERVPDKLYNEWKIATKTTLLNCYGTTETLAIVIASRPCKEKIGSTGKPVSNIQTKLLSKKGLVNKEKGILFLKSPSFSQSYVNLSKKNKSTFQKGWLNTGDLWKIKNNYWYYEGREDDLIKVASKWVNPKEIEKIAIKIEGVLDAFCVAALSEDETHRIALFLYTKLKNNNTIMTNLKTKIELLPNYKKPYWIKIINQLPQTTTGKVRRDLLKKMINKKQ